MERQYGDTPAVECQSKEISQVFYTLLTNAFEAMDQEGTLRIETALRDGRVSVEISDTGPGIAQEQLANLFDVRLAPREGRVAMRLGLPMARYAVERHAGSIDARSRPGEGTTFRIELPAA